MTKVLSPLAESYVRATNSHHAAEFLALFADDAVVNDAGRVFRGHEEIKAWSQREIFDAQVTLDVRNVAERVGSGTGATVITTKVDGNFDRTGLPDPLLIRHTIETQGSKIARLTCQLADGPQ